MIEDNSAGFRPRVADLRRMQARIAFLRALATHSDAIRDLHAQRAIGEADDHFFGDGFSEQLLCLHAGRRRVEAAHDWAERWKLWAPWLRNWGTYALYRWEVGAACKDPMCSWRCGATDWDNPAQSLETALADGRLYLLPELPEGPSPASRYFAIDLLRDVESITPNPLLETKADFSRRAQDVWTAAHDALTRQGISASWPRALDVHAAYLVKFHVLDQTAAAIAGTSGDESTVSKAVRPLADLIDLPIRQNLK